MKSSVVTPGITNHFVHICKRKKYVRTPMESVPKRTLIVLASAMIEPHYD